MAKKKAKRESKQDDRMQVLTEADQLLQDIEQLEEECMRLSLQADRAKEEAKHAKAAYDSAVDRLRQKCRARKEKHPLFDRPQSTAVVLPVVTVCCGEELHGIPENSEVFIEFVKPGGVIVSGADINPTALTDEEYRADDRVQELINAARDAGIYSDGDAWREFIANYRSQMNDAWRETSLIDAGVDQVAAKRLVEADIDTLGKLVDAMRKAGVCWYQDIKGLGESTAAKVSDVVADFWADHPEYCEGA